MNNFKDLPKGEAKKLLDLKIKELEQKLSILSEQLKRRPKAEEDGI